jgi:hypothetical protein
VAIAAAYGARRRILDRRGLEIYDMKCDLALEPPVVGTAQPSAIHEIRGGDGIRLHAREWGNPEGPDLLLIHGWSQSDLCWAKQVNGTLAARFRIVTFDLRGHGLSE